MLYLLTYTWYEDYSPNILEGPEVDDWSAFCDSKLDKAIELALKKSIENDHWCGWEEITNAMVEVLKGCGYKLVQPIEKRYFGSSIIYDDIDFESKINEGLTKITEYNNNMKQTMFDKCKEVDNA